eukprot:TRINITY_DN18636_c0_g1_i1.p1 TRINITY_DN18636_c0_g1~~TRINITY_DN18636_c0_g1_i1.p1  ORF type:complete len:317 (+),score=76.46 TRINITY_DN18636_c0_g1_i1:73-1023(+)
MVDGAAEPPGVLSKTLVASAMAGVFARVPCHPLDTVKARLQSNPARIGSGPTVLLAIARKEGLAGLYRGIGVAAVGSGPAACLYLTSYDRAKHALYGSGYFADPESAGLTFSQRFIPDFVAGFTAEAVSCVLWVPIDVIKERLQVQGADVKGRYKNSLDAVGTVSRMEGLRGLYRGYFSTLGSFGPCSAFYFVFYEQMKSFMLARKGEATTGVTRSVSFTDGLICGGAAAALSSFITNPLDMVKLRLQVQRATLASGETCSQFGYNYTSFPGALRAILRDEGAMTLWRGVGSRVMFAGPQAALTMAIFEAMRRYLL